MSTDAGASAPAQPGEQHKQTHAPFTSPPKASRGTSAGARPASKPASSPGWSPPPVGQSAETPPGWGPGYRESGWQKPRKTPKTQWQGGQSRWYASDSSQGAGCLSPLIGGIIAIVGAIMLVAVLASSGGSGSGPNWEDPQNYPDPVYNGEITPFPAVVEPDSFPAYDPFTPTGPLQEARSYHTATLLADGRVLIAGGQQAPGHAISSLEIYDPTSGQFEPAGNLAVARTHHTATLLDDGRVFIAGGTDDEDAATSTELFDPATGQVSAGPRLNHPVDTDCAVRLNDGRVAIMGGELDGASLVQYYNPRDGSVSDGPQLTIAVKGASAALMADGRVFLASGIRDGLPLGVALVVDPATAEVTRLQMTTAVSDATVMALGDGRILVVGGVNEFSQRVSTIQLYNPTGFGQLPLLSPRSAGTVTLTKTGRMLIVAGQSSTLGATDTIEVVDTTTLESAPVGRLTVGRIGHTATLLADGSILLVGGENASGEPLDDAGVASTFAPMP